MFGGAEFPVSELVIRAADSGDGRRGHVYLGRFAVAGQGHDLSAYDAGYLRLAIDSGIPIATQDRKLVKAASECGVELWPV